MILQIIFYLLITLTVSRARRECIVERVPNADTVCVCNATYCDDFPSLQTPKSGFVNVFESNKVGDRFKQTQLKFNSNGLKFGSLKAVNITINKTIKYQSINGFGAAFTDSTGQMLKSVNESLANLLIDSYFSKDGIEYSMGRIPIAGTDFSDRPYSYDDNDGDLDLKHFALQREDLEWKIPYIKKALSVSPHKVKLFGSPWSPPSWMKTNHKFNESGAIRGDIGGQYYQSWANYFVKFLNAYKSHGISLWGVTVENEPIQGQNPHYTFNCLNLTAPMERDFVKLNLGPTLEKAGYGKASGFNLMVYDDNTDRIKDYLVPILSDKETAKYVSGIAYHWYANHPMGGLPDGLLTELHNTYTNHFLLNTEACHLDGPNLGRWDHAEKYAYDIIRALNNYVTGWVEWNMALDMDAGPRWNDKQGFGGTVNIDPKKGLAYKQPSFYAIGHFSKFVSPESIRIDYKIDKPIDGLSVVTLVRPDNQKVLIVLNAGNEDIVLNIKESANVVSHKIVGHSIQSYIW
ncbi:putative glucosylceramidase 4 [Oppia nitens]|uniref:putative glucosylceramidase 4 n=1 Tax=Oppia nitens TaxID=1686743 RepID=UPI0023DC8F7D|nr:putative glucosylceramidase 4 [Oppia nitens]